jgi:hypothetical protein
MLPEGTCRSVEDQVAGVRVAFYNKHKVYEIKACSSDIEGDMLDIEMLCVSEAEFRRAKKS